MNVMHAQSTMVRSENVSPCGQYLWSFSRTWDGRPRLLVVMFNPPTADHETDDPTILQLCAIASHNGFGGIVVVHGIPLCSRYLGDAIEMTRHAITGRKRDARMLQQNLEVIAAEVRRSGAVLIAWGSLARKCPEWFEQVLDTVRSSLPGCAALYCVEKTATGYPMHPMAKGSRSVPKTAALQIW